MKKPIKTKASKPVSTALSTGSTVERHFRMAEAAQLMGISRTTLFRLLPRIRHCRIPASGLTKVIVLIPASALTEFLGQHNRIPGANRAA